MATTTDHIPIAGQDQPGDAQFVAPADEHAATEQVARALEAAPAAPVKLITAEGQEIDLPATLLRLLHRSAALLAGDRAARVEPVNPRLTPAQAAAVLGFPLDYVLTLLDSGSLPSERVQDERRPLLSTVFAYRREILRRHEGLDELTRLSEEMGLYDLDTSQIKPRRLLEYEDDGQTGESPGA